MSLRSLLAFLEPRSLFARARWAGRTNPSCLEPLDDRCLLSDYLQTNLGADQTGVALVHDSRLEMPADWDGTGRSPSRLRLVTVLGVAAALVALLAILALSATELFFPVSRPGASNPTSISGTISFEGRLIPQGLIEIIPQWMDAFQPDFTPGWAEIRNGEFAHKGLDKGGYLLRIRSELVETHQLVVAEEQLRQSPAPGQPCERPAPVIQVRSDVRNHFDIRFK
jgi:hypothetical protein